jgi:DNA polymerase III alpha subunit (gram-positive type)
MLNNLLRVYLDFEATGLRVMQVGIVQFGATCDRGNDIIIDNFETLVYTDIPMESRASDITGIKNEDLKGKPTIQQACLLFSKWLNSIRKPDEKVVFIAYNGLRYDFPLLCNELYRSNMNITSWFKSCGVVRFMDPLYWAKKHINTTKLKRTNSGQPSFKLGDMYKCCTGTNLTGAHDALADTKALRTLVCHTLFCDIDWNALIHNDEKSSQPCHYCIDTLEFVMSFIKKRQATSGILTTKHVSILDMIDKKKRKRGLEVQSTPPPKHIKL